MGASKLKGRTTEKGATRRRLEEDLRRRQEAVDRDLDLAGWVQRSLIPNSLRTPEAILEVRYLPVAHVAGDYVDFQFVGRTTLYVSVCDVTGHGIAAALLANRTNSEVSRWASEGLSAAEIVEALHRFHRHHFSPRGIYLSIWVGRVDLRTGEIDYAGAGHPPAFLLRARGALIEPLDSRYPLVGSVDQLGPALPGSIDRMRKGDRLVLYTDGLFEVFGRSGTVLGIGGLKKLLRKHRDEDASRLASSVLADVEEFRRRPPRDDLSILILESRGMVSPTRRILRRRGDGEEEAPSPADGSRSASRRDPDRFFLSIPSQPRFLGSVRAMVSRVAEEFAFPERETRELVLAIDEACSNIIKHAYRGAPDGRIDLGLHVGRDAIAVEIRDYGAKMDPADAAPRELDDVRPGGLGTHFMRCCMEKVEFDTSPERGTVLRMTKRRDRPGGGSAEGGTA